MASGSTRSSSCIWRPRYPRAPMAHLRPPRAPGPRAGLPRPARARGGRRSAATSAPRRQKRDERRDAQARAAARGRRRPRTASADVAGRPARHRRRASRPAPGAGRRSRCGSSASRRLRPSAVISAPSAATPNVPPTIRLIERIPDATPALAWSTAFIAAVLIGDMTRPMPMPISTKAPTSERVAGGRRQMALPEQRAGDGDQPGGHQRLAGRCGRPGARRSGP